MSIVCLSQLLVILLHLSTKHKLCTNTRNDFQRDIKQLKERGICSLGTLCNYVGYAVKLQHCRFSQTRMFFFVLHKRSFQDQIYSSKQPHNLCTVVYCCPSATRGGGQWIFLWMKGHLRLKSVFLSPPHPLVFS